MNIPKYEIGKVFIINTSKSLKHRSTKHCVCISLGGNKFLLINTHHREMYDDFEISATDYPFLKGNNRFISCSHIMNFDDNITIRSVGMLKYDDILKIKSKIENSTTLTRKDINEILLELEEWELDNS